MDAVTLLIIIAVIFLGFLLIYSLFKQELATLKNSLTSTEHSVNDALAKNTSDIHTRLLHATEVIGELKREAGAFSQVSRSMQELHDYLRSPKLRGNIGETVLKDLIAQMFPNSSFELQYSFKSGEKVDLIIRTDAGLLPIDSKFPMENFQKMNKSDKAEQLSYRRAFFRDIKSHTRSISSKYILPEEDTLDFALMYIPSESVFYEIASAEDLMAYARDHRVYPVSPNTLYAALQTILLSFEGRKIETRAKEVFQMLRAISTDYDKSLETLSTLGTHLTNASNKFTELDKGMSRLGEKISSTRSLSTSSNKAIDD